MEGVFQSDHVLLDQQGRILTITLNRAEKKNALSGDMYKAITSALAYAAAEESVYAVLVTGSNECFTAGNDLADFMQSELGNNAPVMLFLRQLIGF